MSDRPRIVCLCGSMRFEEEIREAAREESIDGRIVVLPLVNMKQAHRLWADPDAAEATKSGLDDLHKRKVDLADEVLVVCPGGYIGDSTRSEIAYAMARGKPVRYRNERTATPAVQPALPFSFKMDWPNLSFRCNHCSYVCSFFTTDLGEAVAVLQRHHDGAHGNPIAAASTTVDDTALRERLTLAIANWYTSESTRDGWASRGADLIQAVYAPVLAAKDERIAVLQRSWDRARQANTAWLDSGGVALPEDWRDLVGRAWNDHDTNPFENVVRLIESWRPATEPAEGDDR